jgi:Fis family transcriptional regulator
MTNKHPITECIEAQLQGYLSDLKGTAPTDIYQMVLAVVEKPMLELVMQHAKQNQSLAAQYLGIKNFTPTINTFKSEADIGARIEVKWTKYADGHLVIRPTDRINDVAILVTGRGPVYSIAGWIPIIMAKKPKYHHATYYDHWIPQNNLFPIEDLRKSIYGTDNI